MSAARENQNTDKVLKDLLQNLLISPEEERGERADALANLVNTDNEEKDIPLDLFSRIREALADKKDINKRLNALEALTAIARGEVSVSTEPLLVGMTTEVLELSGDKKKEVQEAARDAVVSIAGSITPLAIKTILPHLTDRVAKTNKWTEKVAALQAISKLVHVARDQVALRMPELIPVLSDAMWDTKKEVKKQAHTTITTATETVDNKDINKFIPALIKCISDPKEVPETVHLLGATTFVSEVTMATLSIMVPLLSRGLAERDTAIKRKSAVIIDNMCKLVDDPQVVAPFLGKLYPALKANYANIADPEARNVTERAIKTLQRVALIENDVLPEVTTAGDISVNLAIIEELIKPFNVDKHFAPIVEYAASISGDLIDERRTEDAIWKESLRPFFLVFIPSEKVNGVIDELREKAVANIPSAVEFDEEDDDGEDLCNCEFSLAYGAKILLNRTQLRLKRNRRYGLCGPNGSGKSTLMRAIAEGQVEGFPSDTLKTVYVEHDIDGTHSDTNVLEYVMITGGEAVGSKEEVHAKLNEFGFTDEMCNMPILSLSGGWKMKLALATAVLRKADILLLDEPTNHLDTVNVAWLTNYLNNCGITSIIVSHDSGFLNNVVQYIINYQNFKLHKYKGNLTDFVRKYPPAKSYFELGASEINFEFPEPGFLEGVKTKQKAIVKVTDVSFQYPGTSKPQISGVSFQCSLSSRIAVIGPNGAGKSTLINVLTGELLPTTGEVYTHENCRIAYVKQHAFAHIDNHLDKTPSEYIQWRFQTGEDRETMDRASRQIDENDEQAMNKIYKVEGQYRRVNEVLARRKFKNTYEYEVSFFLGDNIGLKSERWTKMSSQDNGWIPRNELMESHAKAVAEVDMKEALASGQFRPLTRKEIEEHCSLLGLEPELVSHSRIRGLSGGQKVKLVLAACTWQRPHLIVLDEPTNYLDRDSLGALSRAIKKFEGGVVIITHSAEFTKELTEEVWAVKDGKMTPSGHNWVTGQGSGPRLGAKEDEGPQFDALGNKIETVARKKKLSASELRKKKKERMKKKKENPDYVSSDDEF